MFKKLTQPVVLVVAALVLGLMLLLNPSAERHRDAIRDTVNARSPLENVLGVGQLAAFVSRYHSLGLLSYSTVNGKLQSLGVLGAVMVFE